MSKRTDSLIRRLLGPPEPELQCDECFEKIDEYVDLELHGGDADRQIAGMRPHLEGCPSCQEEYKVLRELVQSSG